ncbi:PepSY-associated TM helix domain-containing protein [Altererythrobacter sp.]|uniref:PepSY-associated TM helix domain-containing protein n=1 Tax=Altererythrobacter sp. TaxID=1872480 RepID=UPI001B11BB95|nr:PepSY-associated TM helix domain-containing protein [Altererythrobacter sp.]MBO6610140.1 PepSY domain-containing protein [Altererythrobacter sp.]MBO6641863.1 PepSY domain-containing protein [Altererythrobacter sp.]MBO6709749.1 PepSY domain-containing protein [Altererythrobacter sp.]MBO6944264.1 PepSY domain-containing protein [Altererythrobacter sp.]
MNWKKLFRQIHYWLSLAVFIPAAIMFLAGSFLMLKKEVEWIQPGTERGIVESQLPKASFDNLLAAARTHPEAGISEWSDIDRIDVRVDRGIAKMRANSGWEVQVDTSTSKVLKVAYRRSDVIEQIHDGSFFADWIKLYVFLPTGILLIIMWGTGGYLFLLPRIASARKNRKLR